MTPVTRPRGAEVDRVRTVIRARRTGYALVGSLRRSRPEPGRTAAPRSTTQTPVSRTDGAASPAYHPE